MIGSSKSEIADKDKKTSLTPKNLKIVDFALSSSDPEWEHYHDNTSNCISQDLTDEEEMDDILIANLANLKNQ